MDGRLMQTGEQMMSQDVQAWLRDVEDRDWTVRSEAIRRLEVMGDPAAAPGLIRMLRDESQYVRAAAARALGKLKSAESVPALIAAMDDKAFIVQQSAMWALGDIGPAAKDALPVLRGRAEDPTCYKERIELTVGQVARLAISRIEAEPEPVAEALPASGVPASAAEAQTQRVLTPEERKAKREAALARKRAQEGGASV